MPQFTLNAHQRQLLASCIEIGAEGAADNHEAVGGENSQEDLELIARIIEELTESEADETEITVMPVRLDSHEDDEDDEDAREEARGFEIGKRLAREDRLARKGLTT